MEQYTTATTTTGEQIVVQTANGQLQQQVSSKLTPFNALVVEVCYHSINDTLYREIHRFQVPKCG